MGLIVYAYEHVEKIDVRTHLELEEDENLDDLELHEVEEELEGIEGEVWKLHLNRDNFPHAAPTLEPSFHRLFGETHKFSGNGYHSYNYWRDHLARYSIEQGFHDPLQNCPCCRQTMDNIHHLHSKSFQLKPERYRDLPFYELIHFADNEGVIGPTTSEKLSKDFKRHRENVERFVNARDLKDKFVQKYGHFQKAFELASGDGVVRFG